MWAFLVFFYVRKSYQNNFKYNYLIEINEILQFLKY